MNRYRKAGPAEVNLGRVIGSPRARLYLYGVLGAAAPLLIAYGILTEDTAALWVALGGAILGAGGQAIAAANVPTAADPD